MRLTKIVLASALVVAALPFPANAERPVRHSRADHLAQRARLLRGLPVDEALAAVGTDRASDSWDEAHLVRAGDLDGDKAEDYVDVRYHIVMDDTKGWTETVTLDARRGRDGAQLWTVTLPESWYVIPIFTKVGAEGKPGVVVVSYNGVGGDTDVGGAGEYDLTVTAYSGRGLPVWAFAAPGAGGGAMVAGGAVGDTMVSGVFDAVTGAATDLLLVTASGAESPSGFAGVGHPSVLDGATGAVRPVPAPAIDQDWRSHYEVGDDFDKDGFDDVLRISRSGATTTLAALSSLTGRTIWSNATVPDSDDYWELTLPGDVTGDGVSDVVVLVPVMEGGVIFVPAVANAKANGPTVVLVNGATGKTAWSKRGDYVAPLGDADRKKGVELVVGESLYGSKTGFTAAAYTGSGARVWKVTRTLSSPQSAARASWSAFADFNADGVTDIGYGIYSYTKSGRPGAQDGGSIDGRTGRVSRDVAKDMYGTWIAVDGRGADAYTRTLSGGLLTMTTYTGDTGRKLWTVAVAVPSGAWPMRTYAAYADADKCGEIGVGMLSGESTFTDVILSGKSGVPLWSLTRTGKAAAKVAKPAVKKHAVHRKSC